MKNKLIALAVLGTAMLSSCVQEKSFDNITVGENEIAFVIGGSATRSAVEMPMTTPGASIELCKTDNGEAIYLEETIEEMNASPATRGIPAYNTNLGKLYETMGVYADGNFGDKNFERWDQYVNPVDDPELGWRYRYNYSASPWPDKDTPVDFNLRMPATMNGVTFDATSHYTVFDYTTPAAATDQQDILFAHTKLNKRTHDTYLPNGAPVLMYHALTGVKFRNGHVNGTDTKTIIKKVEIFGLKDKGHCVVTSDDNNVLTFTWTGQEKTRDSFSQEYSNPTYVVAAGAANLDGTVDFTNPTPTDTEDENYIAPGQPGYVADYSGTSWVSAAAAHTLNDGDGSLTFWFVPQEITDEVTMKVTFVVKTPFTPNGNGADVANLSGTDITLTLNFGKELNAQYKTASDKVFWGPGQLRTYSLKPLDVDVDIEDTMQGLVKSNVKIANTGNVPEYVRVLLLGNWYGWETQAEWDAWKSATTEEAKAEHEPSILVGYDSDGTDGRDVMVDPWYRGGYKHDAQGNALENYQDNYGSFDSSFTLGTPQEGNRWIDASGGFYYPDPIGPGVKLNAETEALFQSYTITTIPDIYIAVPTSNTRVKAVGVHLVLTVSVQAIGALDKDGNEKGWLEAWYEATGNKKLNPADHPEWAHNSSSGSGSGN